MHGVTEIRFIVGVIGNVISGFLFIAPVPTFRRIINNKTTEEFHPYPYIATVMNCMFWIFYGLPIVHPDSTLVISINGFGLGMELIYLSIFFVYTGAKYRKKIVLFLLAEIALLAVVAVITLLCFHSHTSRSAFVGIICDVFGSTIIHSMYILMILFAFFYDDQDLTRLMVIVQWQVYKTKSAEFLPIWLCFTGLCNGVCWFAYAFLKTMDYYIAVGNGVGGLFSLVQVIVWTYYTLKEKNIDSDDAKQRDLELQKNIPPVL